MNKKIYLAIGLIIIVIGTLTPFIMTYDFFIIELNSLDFEGILVSVYMGLSTTSVTFYIVAGIFLKKYKDSK